MARLIDALSGGATLSSDVLEHMHARCSRASPGPWLVSLESDGGVGGCNVISVSYDDDEPDLYLWRGEELTAHAAADLAADADFEFVAAAREDIPRLIAEAMSSPERD